MKITANYHKTRSISNDMKWPCYEGNFHGSLFDEFLHSQDLQ
jgi:hypothetical protein